MTTSELIAAIEQREQLWSDWSNGGRVSERRACVAMEQVEDLARELVSRIDDPRAVEYVTARGGEMGADGFLGGDR